MVFWPPFFCAVGFPGRQPKRRRKIEEMQWSCTVDKLLSLVGRGRVDVSCATEIARAVLRDGVDNEAVRKLGSLGAFGSSASNAERDLHRWLSNLFGLRLQPYTVYLDMKALPCQVCCFSCVKPLARNSSI